MKDSLKAMRKRKESIEKFWKAERSTGSIHIYNIAEMRKKIMSLSN